MIHLDSLKSNWATQATNLKNAYDVAKVNADQLRDAAANNQSFKPAATTASLQELSAAKAYNDFLDSSAAANRLIQDISVRLEKPNLSLLERHQLEIEQENLSTLVAEFNGFKVEAGLKYVHVSPVQVDSKIHYVDGNVEWNTNTVTGMLGQTWDGVKSHFPDVVRSLTLSPESQYQACVGVIDSITGGFSGKVLPAPSFADRYGTDVWDKTAPS